MDTTESSQNNNTNTTEVTMIEKPQNKFNLEFKFLNNLFEVIIQKYDESIKNTSGFSSSTHHKLEITNGKDKIYDSEYYLNSDIYKLMNWKEEHNGSSLNFFLFEFRKSKESHLYIDTNDSIPNENFQTQINNEFKIIKLIFKKPLSTITYILKEKPKIKVVSESTEAYIIKNKNKKHRNNKNIESEKVETNKIENKNKPNTNTLDIKNTNIEKLYFEKALIFLNNNKPSEAVKLLEKVIDKGTINRDVMYYLGLGYFKLDQNEQSLKICEQILKLYPKFPEVFILKGDILVWLKKFKEATVCYTDALSLDKKNVDALIGKAKSLFFSKKYDDSIYYIDLALNLKPGLDHYYAVKGLCYKEKKNFDVAKECFEKYINLGGDAPDMLEQIAKFYHEFKEYRTAMVYYDKLISKVPNDVNAYIHKALCLGILQEKKEAVNMCEKAIKIDPSCKKAIEILHILSNE